MSNKTFKSIEILADLENKNSIQSRESLMDFLNPETLILIENSLYVQDELRNSYKLLKEKTYSDIFKIGFYLILKSKVSAVKLLNLHFCTFLNFQR